MNLDPDQIIVSRAAWHDLENKSRQLSSLQQELLTNTRRLEEHGLPQECMLFTRDGLTAWRRQAAPPGGFFRGYEIRLAMEPELPRSVEAEPDQTLDLRKRTYLFTGEYYACRDRFGHLESRPIFREQA